MEWQPIETAPKGDSRRSVLVYWSNQDAILMAWWGDLFDGDGEHWYTDSAERLPGDQLTHWMPLPEPPQ